MRSLPVKNRNTGGSSTNFRTFYQVTVLVKPIQTVYHIIDVRYDCTPAAFSPTDRVPSRRARRCHGLITIHRDRALMSHSLCTPEAIYRGMLRGPGGDTWLWGMWGKNFIASTWPASPPVGRDRGHCRDFTISSTKYRSGRRNCWERRYRPFSPNPTAIPSDFLGRHAAIGDEAFIDRQPGLELCQNISNCWWQSGCLRTQMLFFSAAG